ncbi:MAG: hypothetical protein GF317_04005 [Candidatus Lokiarchaeota archaeon]|nr:hypothetical protein [Candidatus Lokiarchaeota archaeon]MBD3199050.1 hypothetical protein [Candidatus Lokiarchaeota archaeon]
MSPRPMRRRRAIRRAVRRPVRRSVRRTRRGVWRRTRRLVFGSYTLLLIGGTYSVVKLRNEDYDEVAKKTSKPVEELNEDDLKRAMSRLGIQSLELTDADEGKINKEIESKVDNPKYCSYCGVALNSNEKFCLECGKEIG